MNLLEMSYDDINSMRKKTLWSKLRKFWKSCQRSLWFLRFFTCVSWGVSQHKSCWSCRQLLYVTLFFISPLFLCLFNLEFQNLLLPVPSVLSFSFLLTIFSILLFSTLFSIPCSVFSLFIHFISWSPLLFSFQICYPFFSLFLLLYSACFSLMLYSYSICSLSISLHLFRSL